MNTKKEFSQGWRQSKPDSRDLTFEELKKQKEKDKKPVIDDDLMEHEVTFKLILGVPLKELSKVRKAIKNLINKYDVREVETVETF